MVTLGVWAGAGDPATTESIDSPDKSLVVMDLTSLMVSESKFNLFAS